MIGYVFGTLYNSERNIGYLKRELAKQKKFNSNTTFLIGTMLVYIALHELDLLSQKVKIKELEKGLRS